MQKNPALLVLNTCPDMVSAEVLARHLIEASLAACVNILPAGRSIYRWRGAVHADSECLLLIKTTRAAWPRLREAIRARHPYELPEVLAVPVEAGLDAYLQWLDEMVNVE